MEHHLPLRMPLHAEGKGAATFHRQCFNQAIHGHSLDAQAFPDPFYPLPMYRVDFDHFGKPQPMQYATWSHRKPVGGCVLVFKRFVAWRLMFYARLMELLHERAAKGHIHFLETPAHAQHRQPCFYGSSPQR